MHVQPSTAGLILATLTKPSEQREQGPWNFNSNFSRRRKACRPDGTWGNVAL